MKKTDKDSSAIKKLKSLLKEKERKIETLQKDREKSILIKEFSITEDQAYKNLLKKSMDSRKSMKEVAEAIILTFKRLFNIKILTNKY